MSSALMSEMGSSDSASDEGYAATLGGIDRALLHELTRLRKAPQGLRAVHVLSSVVASRRRFEKEADAADRVILSVLLSGGYHKIFHLSNGDIVFIYSQVPTSTIVALCTALETSLFVGVQPHKNVYGDYGNYKIFDLSHDIGGVIDGVRSMLSTEPKVVNAKQPISIKQMEYVSSQIRGTDIRFIIFNQPIYNVTHEKTSIEFLEFYTSIKKLEQLYVPDRSIAANPWLFNLIKRELDAAVMRAIIDEIPSYRHKAFSLNLLVDSFMSDGFREFVGSLPVKLGGRIFVELEKTDLIQHSDFLTDIFQRSKVMRVPLCIDGVSHHDAQMLRMSRMKSDFIKLKWNPEILKSSTEDLEALIGDLKSSSARVILTRCDTPSALQFAKSAGIHFIQGHLADEYFRTGELLVPIDQPNGA
ncbi:EAL domain-containing protein [Telmatospirillum sp.]|uniref:EAL domain-containing protein n=1 Tax=Telmatospirillum sp. TaxID=2079197 RepID=UPI00284D9921|nr:EAL domain-containing protein [Telmatospirillum sp.]MDR3437765.1 EAL domain-containing protein [Telmatospirillum sp.]